MVILDLDDTLCNLRDQIVATMHARVGKLIPWSEWTHYELAGRFDLEPAQMLEMLAATHAIEQALPEPNAAECVERLRELGHRVGIVSARAWHPEAERLTRVWLQQHHIQPDFLKIVRNKGKLRGQSDPAALGKCDAIRPLTRGHGPVAAFVDDCAAHVHMVTERGLTRLGVIYDMPWNRDGAACQGLHRITDLAELPALVGPATTPRFQVHNR